jgi:hypothetical protein
MATPTADPTLPTMPLIAASIDALGFWLTEVDKYLRAIEKLEPKLTVAEQAYGTDLEAAVKAVVMIPGSGEFVYDTLLVERARWDVTEDLSVVTQTPWQTVNRNADPEKIDVIVALDQLQERYPRLECVSLVVSWFGTDLRAGNCIVTPGTEDATFLEFTSQFDRPQTISRPYTWTVRGKERQDTYEISKILGAPAYGGTPSDGSVQRLIAEMNRRKLKVTFYPFILMDVSAGNSLPNPYGGVGQPAFPWRGRITCDPAPGVMGTADRTATARAQIDTFVDNQYWPFIMHYATLCKDAGGVDAFLIGSEMRGLTWVRDDQDRHPFVEALTDLAAAVKTVLPETKVSYASDWSEFVPYQTPDGQLDFHLDGLWSSPAIDAIGIDNYWPTTDWRGVVGIDEEEFASIYDPVYLAGNIQGGEGFDFFYASDADRIDQVRTPITDGLGKPWVFRYKDIRSWWSNQHFNRPAGMATELASPTPWVPQSKPFWFTELGCPAVDKGSNQPNVFIDPKSSESFFPYFSVGTRDDLIQRRHIAAFVTFYANTAQNPTSTVYGGPMVDTSRIYIYTWDARPFPQFPELLDVWSDGPNWERGHWITGRQIDFPLPPLPPNIGTEVDLMPAKPMPKGEPAVDPKTGALTPSMHHYLAQIEQIARRLAKLQIVAVQESQAGQ